MEQQKEPEKRIEEKMSDAIKQQEKYIDNQFTTIEGQMNDSVRKVNELNAKIHEVIKQFGERIREIEIETDEIRLRSMGPKSRIANILLVIFGILFCAGAFYLLLVEFGGVLTIDTMIMAVVLATIGTVMLFVSTLV